MGGRKGSKAQTLAQSSNSLEYVDASVLKQLRAASALPEDDSRRRVENDDSDSDVEQEMELEKDLLASVDDEALDEIRNRQKKYFANNEAGMRQALESTRFVGPNQGPVPWAETLVLVTKDDHEETDATDDFARELAFYKQAVESCEMAQQKFESLGVKYARPEDYFAEMLKTDAHMTKVRKSLLEQRQKIEAVEERRQQRELKKFGKQVQVAKEQARAKQRKSETDAIKEWRTSKKNTDSMDVDKQREEFEVMLDATTQTEEQKNKKEQDGTQTQTQAQKPRVNLKRKRKDEKYGFGGKKKRIKSNTRESTDETGAWSKSKNNMVDSDILRLVPKVGNQRAKKAAMLARQSRGKTKKRRA